MTSRPAPGRDAGPARIARLRSRLAAWTAAETAEGVPRPPPAPSLPPRVLDAAVVAVVAVLNAYPSLFAFLALYSAALRVPLRTALAAGAATALCRLVGVAVFRGSFDPSDAASALTTSALAVAIGLYVGARRAYLARLKERAPFARALASFLPPDVAKLVEASPSSLSLTAELEATVLFCDIRGFSAIAERLGARLAAELVGRFSSAMAAVVADHGGLVDKFAGDAVMALFGVPTRTDDQAARAIRSAVSAGA